MNTQPEALRLADALTAEPDCTCHAVSYCECSCDAIWPEQWVDHAAAELRRLHQHELANEAWHHKTNWVQETVRPRELGLHRADVMRARLIEVEAQRDALLDALKMMRDKYGEYACIVCDRADAAIKQAEGEKT